MTPLRVALCFGTFPPERNGGSDFADRLACTLAERGNEVLVLTSAGFPREEHPREGMTVRREIVDWGFRGDLKAANDALEDAGSQLVHVLFPDSVLQDAYRLPVRLGSGRIPLVTSFFNLGLGRRSPLSLKLEALGLLARSRVLTTHDPTYLKALRRSFGWAKPVRWLPAGSNLRAERIDAAPAELRRSLGLEPDARWLVYFGQLDPTRGVEDLMRALALLRRDRDVRLLMLGSASRPGRYADVASASYLRHVLGLPDELAIDEAVHWSDYLPDVEVVRHLRAADLCVLPYRRNSIGRSALVAALAHGVPTVLSGSPEAIAPLRAGEHVAAVEPRRPELLAAVIARLLADDAERARLGASGQAAADLFSWPRIAGAAEEVYREALSA